LVVALSPEARRRDAGIEVLRRIHGETANQRGEEKKERSRRERRVPGTCERPRRRKGMSVAAGFLVGAWWPARGIGERDDDIGSPRTIPCIGVKRSTSRVSWWRRIGRGGSRAAAPWRGGGVL
jgi:hypothetical protein